MEWLSKPEPRRSAWDEGEDDFFRERERRPAARSYGASTGGAQRQQRSAPASPAARSAYTASKTAPSGGALALAKGDMVEHSAFGKGMVVSLRPMGGDALIEVAFDGVGTKKLMLKSAGVHMKKL